MFRVLKAMATRSPSDRRRLWTIAFLTFAILGGTWSVATPLMASPDEPAHVVRAAAVVRGQVNGVEVMEPQMVGYIHSTWANSGVELPSWYQQLKTADTCYRFKGKIPAKCAKKVHEDSDTVLVTTSAGRYNPVYYFAVGWPSLLVSGPHSVYLMRLVSAVLSALLLASAMVTAGEWRRSWLPKIGVLAAATPMTLFLGGMVNPNGVEIAAGLLFWTAVLSLLIDPQPDLLKRRLARTGVAGVVLLEIRPLGLAWIVGTVFFGLLASQQGAVREIVKHRSARLWAVVLAVALAAAQAWNSTHPDHSTIQTSADLSFFKAAEHTFLESDKYLRQMIGWFGWLDAESPFLTVSVWSGTILLLIMLSLACGRRRDVIALLGLMAAILGIPIVAQGLQASTLGLIWQGRYLLPFAVGLPLLAATILSKRSPQGGLMRARLTLVIGSALAAAQLAAFFWALRRFTVGVEGHVIPMPAAWSPPGTWVLWTVVYALGSIGVVWLVAGQSDYRPPTVGDADGTGSASAVLSVTASPDAGVGRSLTVPSAVPAGAAEV
ncbi:DUF2142 domain-containing protein [Kitasatospora sp. NPDC093679]|uniref:DUF2142 domain-containing protein n=1 Tax=Kitasatospora sp. NPDC093679 TaxID=3154983 RepID=UPI003441FF37